MICFLDIDGVVGNFAKRCKEFFGVEIEARKPLPQNHPVIQTLRRDRQICRSFILGIEPYPYTPYLLAVLRKNFEKILICSKPLTSAYESARFEWVKNTLGEEYSENYIFGIKRKEIFAHPTNFLIDDIGEICKAWQDNGGFALHWHEENIEAMLDEILKLRNEMSKHILKTVMVKMENMR